MERTTFCNGKYIVLNDLRYAWFLAYYTLGNKSSKTCEYQPDELDDNLTQNKYEECSLPKIITLTISGVIMLCRKVRRIFRFHLPRKL